MLEVEQKKREALFSKLNDLQEEIDRDRSRFDTYAALAIETAGVLGETVDKSRVLALLDAIARVFWGAKSERETKRIPPPTLPKRLEPPSAPGGLKRKVDGLDDDIPF